MNKEREEWMNDLLKQTKGYVTIKSYLGPIQERIVFPKKNRNNTWYLGIKPVTEDMRSSGQIYVDPENFKNPLSYVKLKDGVSYDLSNPEDKLILSWLLYLDGQIAINYESQKNNSSVSFYVENEALETKSKMDKYEKKDSATQKLKVLAPEEVVKTARLLGMKSNGASESIRLAIRDSFERLKGEIFIDKFLSVLNDKNREIKLIAMQLVDKGIVIHNKLRSQYTYGIEGEVLGKSFEQYYTRLQDSDMTATFMQMLQEGGLTYNNNVSKTTTRKKPIAKK